MKKLIALTLALMLGCLLLPAAAEEASPVGVWYISRAKSGDLDLQVVDPEAIVLTVNEDGTFEMAVSAFAAGAGTWVFADSALTLTADDEITLQLDGDELVYNLGLATAYLSRTPAEPAALPEALAVEAVGEFDGIWVPFAQQLMGLYSPLSAETIKASPKLSIGGGQVSLLSEDENGEPYAMMSYDAAFEDGYLIFEDETFATKVALSLMDDGTLCYRSVMDLGDTSLETVYYYVPDEEEIIAKLPEPGWVLDSVNGAVWQDDRASLEVFLEDVDNYKVLILWGSSAWETQEWVYACDYDAETQTLRARYVICDALVFDDDGNENRTNVYEKESEAVFSLNEEGKLVLENAGDDSLEGKTFECIGVPAQ